MILAVMTYPKHYHISQIAINHALKHIPNIKEVAIIWDNTHDEKPSAPLNEVISCAVPCYVYPWSAIISNDNVKGWLGQQLVKLHLDNVIDKPCVILDGDLIINQDIDPRSITYANALPRQHAKFRHINEILGLGAYDFGSCPFMYVEPYWLKNIRYLCETHSHTDIVSRFIQYQSPALNEWDLIATYIFQVLKIPRRIEYFNRKAIKTCNFVNEYNEHENYVLDGADDLDLNFYKKHGVWVDSNLMQQLGYINS